MYHTTTSRSGDWEKELESASHSAFISSQVTMDQFDLPDTTSTYEEMGDGDVAAGDRDAFEKFVLALYGIICVVGITGNLLVAIVLLRVPSLRSNTSDFLVHLSIIDFLVCLLVIPFFLAPTPNPTPNPGFVGGEFWCRFYVSQFLFWFSTMTSDFCLITVNLERYVAIVRPHKYRTVFSKRNKYIMIVSCWVLAAVTESYILFFNGIDEEKRCSFIGWPNKGAQAVFGLYGFTVRLFGPLAVMVYAQLKVISTLNRQVKILTSRTAIMGANSSDQRKMWQLQASKTLVRTLLFCVMTFAVCWTPNQIWFLLFNFSVPVVAGGPFHHISVILAVCNSCVNPVIYTMTNKPFRKGIREVFCRQRDSNQVGDNSGVTIGTVS
ncbi:somatostatin receptor type 5-like [Asterias rubens]|uniref:somatostatin receptor type 5-like n=1 Tax=Asterias rubens TaxID=7604 RepID=UPI0014551B13|nr:somatostatin receptor type 5-like [Asterias rubens]